MDGQGTVVGAKAIDFSLNDEKNILWNLKEIVVKKPVLLVFYPEDFTPVCTVQMCSYRDSVEEFEKFNVQILGISSNSVESHLKFSEQYRS